MGATTLVQDEPVTATPAKAPPPSPADAAGPARRRVRLVFFALMLALLLAALEQMIVATALPRIVGELHGPDRMSWAITACLLTATVTLPVYGKPGNLLGRKGVFQFAIVVSALAGRARTMDQLIAFRAVQGVGAGGLLTGVQAIDLSCGEYTVIAAGYPPAASVLRVTGGGRTEHDLQLGHED